MTLGKNILNAYETNSSLSNNQLYDYLASAGHIHSDDLLGTQPVGCSKKFHNVLKRKIRWQQQTLKAMGAIESTGKRGEWRLSQKVDDSKLPLISEGKVLLAYATDLGMALWGSCQSVFAHSMEENLISLVLTSPPYPLKRPRAYGNVAIHEYVDWLCTAIEPLIRNLKPGASICLNLGNDVFVPGTPARSTYAERLVIALEDRFGLSKMDMIPWINPCKPPGPMQWASRTRQQLNVGWEPIYWFTNDPKRCMSNNKRVLEPHSEAHKVFVENGGDRRPRVNSDGAYYIKNGAYALPTAGKIPKNVIQLTHNCADQRQYKKSARSMGLNAHGAAYPIALAEKLIKFLSAEEDLIVDPFAGSNTTGKAAEKLGRRWIATDIVYDYVLGSAMRFLDKPGFHLNRSFL